MSKFHVHKGDEVEVITGANRGRKGKILEVKTDAHRILIEGVNLIKRHVRRRKTIPRAEWWSERAPFTSLMSGS